MLEKSVMDVHVLRDEDKRIVGFTFGRGYCEQRRLETPRLDSLLGVGNGKAEVDFEGWSRGGGVRELFRVHFDDFLVKRGQDVRLVKSELRVGTGVLIDKLRELGSVEAILKAKVVERLRVELELGPMAVVPVQLLVIEEGTTGEEPDSDWMLIRRLMREKGAAEDLRISDAVVSSLLRRFVWLYRGQFKRLLGPMGERILEGVISGEPLGRQELMAVGRLLAIEGLERLERDMVPLAYSMGDGESLCFGVIDDDLVDLYHALKVPGAVYKGCVGSSGLMGMVVVAKMGPFFKEQCELMVTQKLMLLEEARVSGVEEDLRAAGMRFYALRPERGMYGELRFWLNPKDTGAYVAGSYSVGELREWVRGSGPVLTKRV